MVVVVEHGKERTDERGGEREEEKEEEKAEEGEKGELSIEAVDSFASE